MTERRRRSVLVVIMLAVLLAGVAVAAVLVEVRIAPVRQGRQVLEQVRQRGLAGFWPEGERTSWFLHIDRAGRPIGWSVSRIAGGSEGYTGTELQRGPSHFWRENWLLDAAALNGRYQAAGYVLRRLGRSRQYARRLIASTAIELRGGRVVVQNEGHGPSGAAESDVPSNYIPEGMNGLVYYLAASAGKEAKFRLIRNSKAFLGNRVRFITANVKPAGPSGAVVRHVLSESTDEDTWRFGQDGQLVQRDSADGTMRLVPLESLLKTFPEAARYARSLSAPPDANDPNDAGGDQDPDDL